ncbi:MAG: hypothetical protein ACLFWL_07340 [Candidatus Brocadiia bacterium]
MNPQKDLISPGAEIPLRAEEDTSVWWGLVLFGVLWSSIPGFMMYKALTEGAPWFAFLVVGLFLSIGLVAIVKGIANAFSSGYWQFNADSVRRYYRSPFGTEKWEESLDRYRGVLRESEYHSGGQHSSGYTLYKLTLSHEDDEDRSVQLYCSRSHEKFRSQHERYARLFGLPALVEDEQGVTERAVEDLDKSVRERVAEGHLEVDFDPTQPPPDARLRVKTEGDKLSFFVPAQTVPIGCVVLATVGFLGGIGVAISVLKGYLHLEGHAVLISFFVAALSLLGLLLAIAGKVISQVVTVSPEGVENWYTTRWGDFGHSRIPADAIEEILAQKNSRGASSQSQALSVHVISDETTIRFGRNLSPETQKWLRDCLLAVLSA